MKTDFIVYLSILSMVILSKFHFAQNDKFINYSFFPLVISLLWD